MIPSSELLLTPEEKIYHLNLLPEQVADDVILVGDPGRVEMFLDYLSDIEFQVANREFVTVTGYYNNQRVTVMSTGIGVGNIDIVMNELDALVNIDFSAREMKSEFKALNIVRIGTSGALQQDIPLGGYILSSKAIGLDGMLNFHEGRDAVCDTGFEKAFEGEFPGLKGIMRPYVVESSEILVEKLNSEHTFNGVTLTAPGFYGTQGRVLRMDVAMPGFNDKIEKFEHKEQRIANYEMETSALLGYSKLLGHEAATICLAIANRALKGALTDYHQEMKGLIKYTLDKILD